MGRDGDAANVTRDQGRLLAEEVANQLPPRNVEAGKKKVKRDVQRFLAAPIENVETGQDGDGVKWISVGKNFLTGVRDEDDWRSADNASALTVFHLERQRDRGKRYTDLGIRGSQTVRLVNRALVSPLTRFNVIRILESRVGRMKAVFLEVAHKLGGKKAIPEWIRRHIPTPKTVFRDGLGAKGSPSIEFGSRSAGIAHFEPKVAIAVRNRMKKISIVLKQTLFGYRQDHNSGRRIKKKFHASND